MGKRSAHIVALAAAGFHQLLELGHDAVKGAVTCVVHAETVVDLLASVQRQNHVVALTVGEFNHVVIDEHTVCGQGEAEILSLFLLDAPRVSDQVLDDLEVHQRLTAKEVNLQIVAVAGIFNQKIQSALADLKGHDRAVTVVLALAGKAVGAIEVAGVGDVEAQRLDDTRCLGLEMPRHGLEGVGGEELARFLERDDLSVALLDIGGGDILAVAVFFVHGSDDFVLFVGLKHLDDVVGYLVYYVDGTGADVQHHVVAAELVLMDHVMYAFFLNFFGTINCCLWAFNQRGRRGGPVWPPAKKIVDPQGFCRCRDDGRPHRVAPTGFR